MSEIRTWNLSNIK